MGLPLVTRTEYKTYAGITSTTQDAVIDSLITKISSFVKSICRRTFVDYVSEPKVDYFEGPALSLVPTETPILSITSLENSTDYGNTYTELVEYTDWVLRKSDSSIKAILSTGFPELINGYKLTYTCGYETLPDDLKLAIFDLISYYIRNDSAIHSNKAPGTNSVQIEYVTTTNLPAHIKRVLDLYTENYN